MSISYAENSITLQAVEPLFLLTKAYKNPIKIKPTKGLQLIANQFFKNTVTKAVLMVSRMRILPTESSLIH